VTSHPGRSAAELAESVRLGGATAVEIAEDHLEAIEASKDLNAFTSVDAARILQSAAAVDAGRAAGRDPGPLAGVPVALKDLIDHRGWVTTCGSGFHRRVPDSSATAVDRIEAAGGVVVGRTGLHEFAFGFSSENDWFGPVHNPWDPALSPGGSSGGSAAAVAARLAPLAVGTDTGGSVRVPAALCGVVGLKVTHGRIPLDGVFPLAPSFDTVGPITRSIEDAALLYRVMASEDPLSSARPSEPSARRELATLRIAVPAEWVDTGMDPQTRGGFTWALERISATGAVVEEVREPRLVPSPHLPASFGPEVAAVHRRWFLEDPERYGPSIRGRLARVMEIGPGEHLAAVAWRERLEEAFARVFAGFDLIATPTVAARRKTIGRDEVETEAGPVPYRTALSHFTAVVNHASIPALAMPLAAPGEPPPSLQIIGPAGGEEFLLHAGRLLEEVGVVSCRTPEPGG
jgi:Asp-tRNA(Asn)/Glu-tRNA(Gln) amidotransferase A subunit family amidase